MIRPETRRIVPGATARVGTAHAAGGTADVGTALRSWTADRILTPVTVTLVLVALVCASVRVAGYSVPMAVQLVPFAVSILVFGLPHGALDHLVPARLRPGTSTRTSIAVVVVLYLVVGSATAALWAIAPLLGFTAFIAITWFHWGQGDLYVDRLLQDGTTGRAGAALTVTVRGALPMLVPFVAQPAAAVAVVSGTVAALGGGAVPGSTAHTIPAAARLAAAAFVVVLIGVHLVVVRRNRGALRRQCVEDVVLLAFFTLVPPVLAVGLYFTLWHAVRHILRLELTDRDSADDLLNGRVLAPFLRFMRQAWPITAIAVGMLVGLAIMVHRTDLGVYLALIAALTTPHTVVVTWMDRVQRTWHSGVADSSSPAVGRPGGGRFARRPMRSARSSDGLGDMSGTTARGRLYVRGHDDPR
jgi:Brp/Blh family beta-carotene 15,15'-monooxygenase